MTSSSMRFSNDTIIPAAGTLISGSQSDLVISHTHAQCQVSFHKDLELGSKGLLNLAPSLWQTRGCDSHECTIIASDESCILAGAPPSLIQAQNEDIVFGPSSPINNKHSPVLGVRSTHSARGHVVEEPSAHSKAVSADTAPKSQQTPHDCVPPVAINAERTMSSSGAGALVDVVHPSPATSTASFSAHLDVLDAHNHPAVGMMEPPILSTESVTSRHEAAKERDAAVAQTEPPIFSTESATSRHEDAKERDAAAAQTEWPDDNGTDDDWVHIPSAK